MSPSKMRKSPAWRDGVLHADGGPDLRSRYIKRDEQKAYDLGYQDHVAYLKREAEHHDETAVGLLANELEIGRDDAQRALDRLQLAGLVTITA